MNRISRTIIATGISLVCLVEGTLLISIGYKKLKDAQESLNWPTTEGVIISSKIQKSQGDNSTTYEANVSYKSDKRELLFYQ